MSSFVSWGRGTPPYLQFAGLGSLTSVPKLPLPLCYLYGKLTGLLVSEESLKKSGGELGKAWPLAKLPPRKMIQKPKEGAK